MERVCMFCAKVQLDAQLLKYIKSEKEKKKSIQFLIKLHAGEKVYKIEIRVTSITPCAWSGI